MSLGTRLPCPLPGSFSHHCVCGLTKGQVRLLAGPDSGLCGQDRSASQGKGWRPWAAVWVVLDGRWRLSAQESHRVKTPTSKLQRAESHTEILLPSSPRDSPANCLVTLPGPVFLPFLTHPLSHPPALVFFSSFFLKKAPLLVVSSRSILPRESSPQEGGASGLSSQSLLPGSSSGRWL